MMLGTALMLSGCVYYVPVPTTTPAVAVPPQAVVVPAVPVYAFPFYPYPYYGWRGSPWFGGVTVRGAFRFH
jgi:hypothetical protein